MRKLRVISRRSADILKTEGLNRLFVRSIDFISSRIFKREYFYLYEHTIKERNAADFMPKVRDFDFRMIAANTEADELAKSMHFDFREHILNARERLNGGAAAFLIFIGGEFAYIGWAAPCEEAKKLLDARPYRVDFVSKQACTGGNFTFPKFRGEGLMTYGYFRIFEFLRQKGFSTSRNVVSIHNLASQKVHAKFNPRVCARVRYTRILWWHSWKEFPISPANLSD